MRLADLMKLHCCGEMKAAFLLIFLEIWIEK
jgi:hypothetical protein